MDVNPLDPAFAKPLISAGMSPGQLAQAACLLEVTARKPGNVHRGGDLDGLRFIDFLLSSVAIGPALDRAVADGIGIAVHAAIQATRRVVNTNTNLGMVLLLAPLAAVPAGMDISAGLETVLAATTIDDARQVYRAIRIARPGGLGEVDEEDVRNDPTITLRAAMELASDRDLVARQYANGFREVLAEALPALRQSLDSGQSLDTGIITAHLYLLSRYPDSLIARKYGLDRALEVSRRAGSVLAAGWPDRQDAQRACESFDGWLRHPAHRFNPGTTADLVTAALFVALREGSILSTTISP